MSEGIAGASVQELELMRGLLTRGQYGDAETMGIAASALHRVEIALSARQGAPAEPTEAESPTQAIDSPENG